MSDAQVVFASSDARIAVVRRDGVVSRPCAVDIVSPVLLGLVLDQLTVI